MTEQPDAQQAWSDYWRGQKGGCLPVSASTTLDAAFRQEWQRTASLLEGGARVLDLATGDGVVLRWLGECRSDLRLVGVDLADPIPPAPKGAVTTGGVAMEKLPFAAGSFDAVVSQFGFEYGDIDRSAAEVARVLKAAGRLVLVTHHADGPIVAHNRKRAIGLRWVLDEARLIELARADELKSRNEINRGPQAAVEKFGRGSAGWQLAEAVARVVRGAGPVLDRQGREMLDRLERMARGEIQRIRALVNASTVASASGGIEGCLARHGIDLVEGHPIIHVPDGLTVAYYRTFVRR